MRVLLMIFLITLFIPKEIALMIGTVALTPSLACSIVLFPILLFGGKIRFAWPDIVVVLYYLATLYSTLVSAPFAEASEFFGRLLLLGAVPYLVGRYLGSRPASFARFMRPMIAAMAVFGVFILIESLFRFNIHSVIWDVPYTPHKDQRLGLTRAHGWTSHAIMLGVSYAAFVPIVAITIHERIQGFGKFRRLKFVLLIAGVFCSLSTGAWLPTVLSLGLVVWDYLPLFKPGTRWLIMSLGTVSSYFVLEALTGRPIMRILMLNLHLSDPMAWYYRWRLYERVYSVMPGYEWFGHGIATPATLGWQWSIDNNFLVVLMQYGRVGLTLWISVAVSVLVFGWKAVWNAPDTPYRRVARAVMFTVVTVGLTQFSVALFSTAAMINWLFLGLGVGLAQGLATMSDNKSGRARKRPAKQRPSGPSAQQRSLPGSPNV